MHAIRNLARIGFGTVAVRWSQPVFGRTSTTSTSQFMPYLVVIEGIRSSELFQAYIT